MPRQATHFVSFCQVLEWLVGFFSFSLSLLMLNPLLSLTEEGWLSSSIEWPPLSYWRLCHCVKVKISLISSRFHQFVILGCFIPSFANIIFFSCVLVFYTPPVQHMFFASWEHKKWNKVKCFGEDYLDGKYKLNVICSESCVVVVSKLWGVLVLSLITSDAADER